MSGQRYTPEFKDEAVKQVIDRGYTIAEVSERLGVSSHSLYKWVNAVKPTETEQQRNELLEAKSEILIVYFGFGPCDRTDEAIRLCFRF